MEKLLIVDDEPWIIEGLKRQLNWEEMGIEVAGEAGNGEEAVKVLLECNPSIVLADIRMPKMDGLKLAKYISENKPDIVVILISGYADFNYAKKAIEYGVTSYVTKPIEDEELEEGVQAALQKIREYRDLENIKKSQFYNKRNRELSERYLSKFCNQKEEQAQASGFYVAVFQLYEPEMLWDVESDYYFQRLVQEWILGRKDVIFFQNHDNSTQFVMIIEVSVKSKGERTDIEIVRAIDYMIAQISSGIHINVVVGISGLCSAQSKTFEGFLQAKFIAENAKRDIGCRCITKSQFDQAYLDMKINTEKIQRLSEQVEYGNEQNVMDLYNEIMQECWEDKKLLIHLRLTMQEILLTLSGILQKYESNMYSVSKKYVNIFEYIWRVESFDECKEDLFILVEDVLHFISLLQNAEKESPVLQMKRYMVSHYQEQITLNDMAAKYYMNFAYLSRAFKKEAGINFNDYLKRIRMEKGAELLCNTDLKMYEIAERVGYDNVNYFFKKFREVYGVTPSQYKDQVKSV